MSARLISKLGLVIIFIGCFMPTSCNISCFNVIRGSINPENDLNFFAHPEITIFILWLLFISVCIGTVIFIRLLLSKQVNESLDTVNTVVSIILTIIAIILVRKNLEMNMQIGAWIIIGGAIISLIFFVKKLLYEE